MTWTLHPGDCLDPVAGLASLADRSVDHVITDPPFEAEAHTRGRRLRRSGQKYVKHGADHGDVVAMREAAAWSSPILFPPMKEWQRTEAAIQLSRVSRRWIVVFCQMEAAILWRRALEDAGAVYKRTGIWHKPDGQPQLTGDRPGVGYETMVIAHAAMPKGSGRSRWNGGGHTAVWTFTRCQAGQHQTQKPLRLMSALVADFTDRGETILDPFAGSGTTGVAAILAGRSFVGWELDAKYHQVATRRLSETREQASLLEVAAPRAEQLALIGK